MSIQEITFGPKTYLTLRKSIHTDQITDKEMYDDAGKKLGTYMREHGMTPAGPWSVLYFLWDETNKKADIGIAFPVHPQEAGVVNDPELSVVTIPESKVAMDTLKGPYSGLGKIHEELMNYSKEKNYAKSGSLVMAIEEYVVDPMSAAKPEDYVTNIYYLHN
jgi:effector-binding domain-containing protein